MIKKFLSRPDLFKPEHTHTDVRLALGYANVLIALGSSFYGYKNDFETAKPVVWAGVILYVSFVRMHAIHDASTDVFMHLNLIW